MDTFLELVFLKLLNNDGIKCKKSFTIKYRRHVYMEHLKFGDGDGPNLCHKMYYDGEQT